MTRPNALTQSSSQPTRRIGLMGGSFDPVHAAHVALAETALHHLRLDEVRWIPVGQPWQKARQLTAAEHRLAMVKAATAHEPRFVVDDIELRRAGPSYTVETFKALQSQAIEPTDWFLIIGQDQYANLPTWHGWHDLLQGVTLAVACRGHDLPQPAPQMQGLAYRVVELPLPPLPVSSTDIRARLHRGDDPDTLAPALVPASVARYIANHQLYAPVPPH